jgi:hypothetical protein
MPDPTTPECRRESIAPTYDSRETGPRYHVTTQLDDRTIEFQKPIDDPFVRHTVHLGWGDLLRGLFRRRLAVIVKVGGDLDIVNDVLELDDNALVPGSTRQRDFQRGIHHKIGRLGGDDA